jgi:hypothetical protein
MLAGAMKMLGPRQKEQFLADMEQNGDEADQMAARIIRERYATQAAREAEEAATAEAAAREAEMAAEAAAEEEFHSTEED